MRLNCFRSANSRNLHDLDQPSKPRPVTSRDRAKTSKSRILRRHGSADSRSSTCSNENISKLPPCPPVLDPKIEAMMMPVPGEERPSRCLRLSLPKTYSDIVESMKAEKKCRDWRSFPVFEVDEIDMNKSAVEVGNERAADYARRVEELYSFDSGFDSDKSIDMVG